MASNAINPEHGAAYSTHRTHRDRRMRADYVLVSEERESGSEYSSSTCCCCSSCESGCSCEEYSEDEDEEEGDDDDDNDVVIEEEEEEEEEGYWSDCSACWARRDIGRRGRTGRRYGHRYMNIPRAVEASDVSGPYPAPAFSLSLSCLIYFRIIKFQMRLTSTT